MIKRGDTRYFQKKVNGKRVKIVLSKSLSEAKRMRDECLEQIAADSQIMQEENVKHG
jgi:hypothetical protein